jgi:hypothetical protein
MKWYSCNHNTEKIINFLQIFWEKLYIDSSLGPLKGNWVQRRKYFSFWNGRENQSTSQSQSSLESFQPFS